MRSIDDYIPRIIAIALVILVIWLVLPFPKTFQARVDMPQMPAPVVKVVTVGTPAVVSDGQAGADSSQDRERSRGNWWPPLPIALVMGVTLVAVVAVRTFKPGPDRAAKAPAVGATTSLTILGVLAAALPQFEDKLGDQSYLLAILAGCLTIAPLVGGLFKGWKLKAAVMVGLLALMIGGFSAVFSLNYPLGPVDPATKQPTVVSGWTWLLSDISAVTPGVWASLVVLAIVFAVNVAMAFWKPKTP